MKTFLYALGISVSILSAQPAGRKDAVPSWVDTVAPKVQITPRQGYARSPLFVSLTSDKKTVIRAGFIARQLTEYDKPIMISREGRTVLYYYAEDMLGNRSPLDSAVYILDFNPPQIDVIPAPGLFTAPTVVHIRTSEPCRLYTHTDSLGRDTVRIRDSIVVMKLFNGYVTAIDRSGNSVTTGELTYVVDTATVNVRIQPQPGLYNRLVELSFVAAPSVKVFYTFNPLSPPEWFTVYAKPVRCPSGLSVVRYYAVNERGRRSVLMKSSYIVDTVVPRIKYAKASGAIYDTVLLTTKEKSTIRYSFEKNVPLEQGFIYNAPLLIRKTGKVSVRAMAIDVAGNVSENYRWNLKYDTVAPTVKPSPVSGTYTAPFALTFSASEPVKILYTLDGSDVTAGAFLYKDKISISRGGQTTVRYLAFDEAENSGREGRLDFYLDILPPKIRVKIGETSEKGRFRVLLQSDKPATIYYEIGEKAPSLTSMVYTSALTMSTGQELRYFGVDAAGNRSDIAVMNELRRPMAVPCPESGIYNSRVRITFTATNAREIYWCIFPDTLFKLFNDTISINAEGNYALEYYAKSDNGLKGPMRRSQYSIDWTPPNVAITIKKKNDDSVLVFFTGSKNATIYYTVDGTHPLYSKTTRTAANKFTSANDRIVLARNRQTKLAFIAEDIAGNQGKLSVLDIFKPHAVPNVPANTGRAYNRIISLSLSAYDDQSQIYYERHGKTPTLTSPVFSEPITLVQSDTLRTFVVDASGYRGEVETFIYRIDLPPSPQFTFSPQISHVNQEVTFDASSTLDHETSPDHLVFVWDFNGDQITDVTSRGNPVVQYSYSSGGRYAVSLAVTDGSKQTVRISKSLSVIGTCPEGMEFIPRNEGKSFCIDRYEWPNDRGVLPLVNVSWIRAKMYCYDEGKRLCKKEEWRVACEGGEKENQPPNRYPYGREYRVKTCPTEGEKSYKAGQFTLCRGSYMVDDMIGNVWEWVNDREDGSPVIVGGSYEFGVKAQCDFTSKSSLISEAKDIGFRCCK